MVPYTALDLTRVMERHVSSEPAATDRGMTRTYTPSGPDANGSRGVLRHGSMNAGDSLIGRVAHLFARRLTRPVVGDGNMQGTC